MRPVNNVPTGVKLSTHGAAKPNLIAAMGEYCVYCERRIAAMELDVEHIEPLKTHPHFELTWGNFLLACSTCNTYKRHYQEKHAPIDILANQAWPHLDNTFSAYLYDQYGRVKVVPTLSSAHHAEMAQRTLEMAGLDKTPAVAAKYQELGRFYDTTSRRERAWRKAQIALTAYLQNPTDIQRDTVLNQAEEVGFFSIWMAVFSAYPEIKRGLIQRFQAAPECFDAQGAPKNPRQPGRI
jgi:uncharacterized protein (TIGR02646 family)